MVAEILLRILTQLHKSLGRVDVQWCNHLIIPQERAPLSVTFLSFRNQLLATDSFQNHTFTYHSPLWLWSMTSCRKAPNGHQCFPCLMRHTLDATSVFRVWIGKMYCFRKRELELFNLKRKKISMSKEKRELIWWETINYPRERKRGRRSKEIEWKGLMKENKRE